MASCSGLAPIACASSTSSSAVSRLHAPDLLQVHAHRVVQQDRIHHLDVEQHLVVDLLDLFEVLLAVDDFDADLFEGREDAEDLVGLGVDLGEALEDVVGREVALLLALDDQMLRNGDQLVFELVLRSSRSLGGAPRPGLDRGLYYTCDLLPARFHVTDSASELPCLRRSGASGVAANLIGLLSAIIELSRVLAQVEQVFRVVAGVAPSPALRWPGQLPPRHWSLPPG